MHSNSKATIKWVKFGLLYIALSAFVVASTPGNSAVTYYHRLTGLDSSITERAIMSTIGLQIPIQLPYYYAVLH